MGQEKVVARDICMREHASCSGSACKKLLRRVSLPKWKLHEPWHNKQNISRGLIGGAKKASQDPLVAMPALSASSPALLLFKKPASISCYCLADICSKGPDSSKCSQQTLASCYLPPSSERFCSSFPYEAYGPRNYRAQQREPNSSASKMSYCRRVSEQNIHRSSYKQQGQGKEIFTRLAKGNRVRRAATARITLEAASCGKNSLEW